MASNNNDKNNGDERNPKTWKKKLEKEIADMKAEQEKLENAIQNRKQDLLDLEK
ncbi:hypothetical protein I4U23_016889 [Adineta vaga]|nr:hypothetical protein I4U23_016882 [Adineta vaga]UJR12715.1 hypothetical protein I4U23_016889 [Adineta vaga]